jgi:uncharacterized protein YabE (DUF348 family)
VRPSPARAEPHDATAWLPLPAVDGLPPVGDLLAPTTPDDTLPARDVPVGLPSPARAVPHDATAWLPLPEVEELPPIDDLLVPDPDVAPPAPRDVPVGLPSPARAVPHDATAWLPVPDLADRAFTNADADDPELAASGGSRRPRFRVGSHVRRRRIPLRQVAIVVAVVLTVGGGYYGVAKLLHTGADVQLNVDGKTISANTGVDTVGAFLKERHVTVGAHDRVSPPARASIANGMVVNVIRAFAVQVDFDGAAQTMYTTHHEPTAFLSEQNLGPGIGLRNPPKRIDAQTVLAIRRVKHGTLLVDGQTVHYRALAHTVSELLADYKIVLGPSDVTNTGGAAGGQAPGPIAVTDVLPDNTAIAVFRVATETLSVDEAYSVPDEQQPDSNAVVDAPPRIVPGKAGVQKVTYAIRRHNGVEVARTPISFIPIDRAKPTITYYGSNSDPRWDKIAECETGTNWSHRGSGPAGPNTYQGGLGIWYGNWSSQGGTQYAPSADLATQYQQIIIAMRIQKKFGWGAWGCGKTLGYAKEDGKRQT